MDEADRFGVVQLGAGQAADEPPMAHHGDLVPVGDPVALAELVRHVVDGRVATEQRKGLQLERIDGSAVLGHPLEGLLEPAGFRPTATKYVARR